jgi:hypothetical protein
MASVAQATIAEREVSIMKLTSPFTHFTWLDCLVLYGSHALSHRRRWQYNDDTSADAAPHPED